MSLAVIISWLSKSGLKVNANKTEICHFSRNDHLPINISINGDVINTKPTINVLGVIFDSKLQWGPQVTATITKASRALNAIRLIKHYFTQQELLQLITSNFYSVLFYNSEVWHLNTLKQSIKNSCSQSLLKQSRSVPKQMTIGSYPFPNSMKWPAEQHLRS